MKRSEINREIREAIAFFSSMHFFLPPWAVWQPTDWQGKSSQVEEIIKCGLGWDITDFGSGDFQNIGLINFNLRNGTPDKQFKPYCEKAIIVKENQVTPMHTHNLKIEDIINRGGGNLIIELFRYDKNFSPIEGAITVKIDAIPITVASGGKVTLTPGESICLEPGIFHKFYSEQGKGMTMVGEVSAVNNDATDNVFVGGNPRFPHIEEDEEPLHLLVNDYRDYI